MIDYWLKLASNPAIGARTLHKLRAHLSDAQSFAELNKAQLQNYDLDERTAQLVLDQLETDDSGVRQTLHEHSIHFLWFDDEEFPESLRQIPDPPACLFRRGEPLVSGEIMIAMVGSRKATPYGRQVATMFAQDLAQAGITIVSGLAFGIDAVAHQATLDAGGRTVAVLGNGLDDIFPTSHRALAREIIAKGGTILSEFPPGTPPLRHHFPIRNRIIAGLAVGTLVVEAAEESGSLITARLAIESGREVFAVPGPITSPVSAGPHGLIRIGAKLVTGAMDIIEELGLENQIDEQRTQAIVPDSANEAALLERLTHEPIELDDLIRVTMLDAATVTSTLLMMEMKGKARNLGANQYVRGH